ncbi:hypothetical protein SAMN06295885_0302 [Rathayibacter oskolensis]|uniref:Uncharacterized protein n=1 Tax=Rathayibacter oskolensis TaxID=1891671 RepID=A0A1X7MZE9_9MICO|nr:hypothetical protein [Rathayibacter oskolensis]SMH29413.1 hypothetical protein SAMN06295885_0302 [Rathayibacter oskolensis]
MEQLPIPHAAMIAAQALIDSSASFDGEATAPVNLAVLERALRPIEEGVLDADGIVVPTASDVAGAAVICLTWLTGRLVESSGRSSEEILFSLREFVTEALRSDDD